MIRSGTIGTSAFTLPVGYIPSKTKFFAVSSNQAFGEVIVLATGTVTPRQGTNVWVALDGVEFYAES